MALAALRARNPLRVGGTALPPELLLAAKLLALALVGAGFLRSIGPPFLPFVRLLDSLPGALFGHCVRGLFVGALVLLLLNLAVRAAAAGVGIAVVLTVLAIRPEYQNNALFCATLLILIGLHPRGASKTIFRLQLALIYFAAGLNKLLEPDWRSGVFFDNWTLVLHKDWFRRLSSLFPGIWLARLAGWLGIATELGLAGLIAHGRAVRAAAWMGLAFHIVLTCFSNTLYGTFFFASQVAFLTVVPWPVGPVEVRHDPRARRVRRLLERLDLERTFVWREVDVPVDGGLELVLFGTDRRSGYAALRTVVLYNPVVLATLFAFAELVMREGALSPARKLVSLTALLLASPLFVPVGERLWRRSAR